MRRFQPPQPRPLCGGKQRYASKQDAEQAAQEQMLLQFNLELNVYKCPFCGDWHLTRTPPPLAKY